MKIHKSKKLEYIATSSVSVLIAISMASYISVWVSKADKISFLGKLVIAGSMWVGAIWGAIYFYQWYQKHKPDGE